LDHEVPFLEEKWGDHLFESKQFEQGINHFLNAGQAHKAIECAIEARHWKKAAEMLEKATKRGGGDASRHEHQYLRLARHHESVDDVDDAERCFLRASAPGECVEMYARLDRWDRAHKIAVGYMTDADAKALYVKRGRELESNGRYAEAEKAYVAVNEHDTAIAMYEKHGQHAHVLRLVSQHRPETLRETRAHLATTMENDGNYRDAERQYVEAGDWKAAVAMYKT
jgi:intraflagellar transport protein 172